MTSEQRKYRSAVPWHLILLRAVLNYLCLSIGDGVSIRTYKFSPLLATRAADDDAMFGVRQSPLGFIQ